MLADFKAELGSRGKQLTALCRNLETDCCQSFTKKAVQNVSRSVGYSPGKDLSELFKALETACAKEPSRGVCKKCRSAQTVATKKRRVPCLYMLISRALGAPKFKFRGNVCKSGCRRTSAVKVHLARRCAQAAGEETAAPQEPLPPSRQVHSIHPVVG